MQVDLIVMVYLTEIRIDAVCKGNSKTTESVDVTRATVITARGFVVKIEMNE